MSEQELIEENKKLKERVEFLENIINKGSSGNTSAYNEIRLMIIEKVQKEYDVSKFEEWQRRHKRQIKERKLMSDLKWELRVRNISDFRVEHIQLAKEYIEKYKIEDF